MIVELTVENLAIIERSQLLLGAGFTVLTGETGAGKSLLVDAIELALGERADSDLVRSGQPRASVSVVFDFTGERETRERCQELGIATEGGRLFIQREIAAEGRSQCRVGGRLAPLSTLRQLGALLVDLHGQHDHQSLLDPERHVGFLDDWIGAPASGIREQVAELFEKSAEAERRLSTLRQGLKERERQLDFLRYQIQEIDEVNPRAGETELLEAQLSRLKFVERLAEASFAALAAVADDEDCAIDRLRAAIKALETATRFDPLLEEVAVPLRAALIELEESAHGLRSYADGLETDPETLEEIAARVDALKRLRRKYGADEAEILAFLADAREKLAVLEDVEASEESLAATAADARRALDHAAAELSALRQERAVEFATRVQAELRDLAMDRAIFSVGFQPKPPDAGGADEVEFFFSANLGEPPRPLSRIASGGEISRVMLAIKAATAGRAGVPTLIFDEVDAGLGGRAAVTVARKLAELATHYQVLVITHLPQIAGQANRHLHIDKGESNGRVTTTVRVLEGADRVEEISRMLAGDRVTETVRASARELLAR